MEKVPLYESFKQFGMTQKEQILKAYKNKEWGWIIFYVLLVLIILISLIGYSLTGFNLLISQIQE